MLRNKAQVFLFKGILKSFMEIVFEPRHTRDAVPVSYLRFGIEQQISLPRHPLFGHLHC